MTTAASTLLGLALPVTGELQGTWGDTVNNSITNLLDTAVAGTTTLSTDVDVTLTTTTLAANQARQAILLCSGARTALRTITAPAQSKIYTIINATTGGYSVKLVGVGPTTGVTVVAGESALVAWNGSDFIKISNTGGAASFTNVTVSGTTTLSGLTASTALALDASKNVVSVTNTGSGNNVLATSPTLTTPNLGTPSALTLTNATGLPLSTGVTGTLPTANGGTGLTSFTANGIVYASSSSALTTGSGLVFNGTNLGLGITPSSWGLSGGVALQTTAGSIAAASTTNFIVAQNAYYNGSWLYKDTGPASYYQQFSSTHTWTVAGPGTAGTAITFTDAMTLNSSGNLGIGTSSPGYKLDVNGNAYASNWYAPSTAFTVGTVGGGVGIIGYGSTGSGGLTNTLLFQANGEKMRLDSSGNLGLGVTPSAWASVIALQMPNSSAIAGNNQYLEIETNTYYNAGYKYIGTGLAAKYTQEAGKHVWYNAPSGTAGNVISFTQAMTLDASGNLGVGTTSPSALLDASSGGVTSYASPAARFLRNHGGQSYSNLDGLQVYWNTSNGSGESEIVYGSLSTSYLRFIHNNAGTFTERMRLDSSGNLGIGTTSPSSRITVGTTSDVSNFERIQSSTAIIVVGADAGGGYVGTDNSYALRLFTNNTERARIDSSGNLLVGTTSGSWTGSDARIYSVVSSGWVESLYTTGSAGGTSIMRVDNTGAKFVDFRYTSTNVGSITTNGTATSYSTSSDYRLKEDIQPMTGALAKVAALKPCTYKWKVDGSDGEGFIAHELADVVPQCVTGEKDAVDADGSPVYQGVDTSFLIATLTAAIKEQQAQIESLTQRLAAAGI